MPPIKDYLQGWKTYQEQYNKLVGEMLQAGTMARPISIGIIQIYNPELGVVDRCATCHISILDAAFRDAPQPYRTHPKTPHNLAELGCTICHGGDGRATSQEDAHGGGITGYGLLPGQYVAASCGQCHAGNDVPEAYALNAGRRLIEESDCAACHIIPGFAKNSESARAPDLDGIGDKVKPQWLYRWLKDPKAYLPRTRMPAFHLSDEEASILTVFLLTKKTSHSTPAIPPNGSPEEGQTIFRERRCVSCHAVDGRGGTLAPDLGKAGSKLNPEWLPRWLESPKQVFHATRMPQFAFPRSTVLAVSSYISSDLVDDSEDEAETQAILRRLTDPTVVTLKRGRELFERLGCSRCHHLEGIQVKGEFGPDLTNVGSQDIDLLEFGNLTIRRTLPSWLMAKMKDPRGFGGSLLMPDYQFTDEEAQAVVTALLSITSRSIPPPYLPKIAAKPEFRPAGEFGRVAVKYQCLTCHRIQASGGALAPDLTLAGSQLKPEWLRRYFKLPYTVRPILKERMPIFDMSEMEIDTAVSYIRLALRDDSIPEELFDGSPSPDLVKQGRALYETYACHSCHQVGMNGGYVGPPLDGVGERLHSGYIFSWLRNPQAINPDTIDPNRGLSEERARALTAYLLSLPSISARSATNE
ncbi:MAG: c-type cytochrome [Acidobacteria bacterium]|nr:c-type cytochrome [Acidobacteriota bacterium]